jgi:hypothetical protein
MLEKAIKLLKIKKLKKIYCDFNHSIIKSYLLNIFQ